MVVDNNVIEIGKTQGFTRIIEPKREKTDPPSIPPYTSKGWGIGGGASQSKPPRGGSCGCVTLNPVVENLDAEEGDDNEFTEEPRNEEDEAQYEDPYEEDEGEDDENEDEVQVVAQSRPCTSKSATDKALVFDPEIHDITGYEKADIIKLRNTAFNGNAKYAKMIKGTLLNLPPSSLPSIQQINFSELFALRAPVPQKDKSGNDDEDEEGHRSEANIHELWLPFLQGNGALRDCPPSQFKPPGDWSKLYTSEGLQTHFPIGVTAWKSCEPLPILILIIMVPPNSPPFEKAHFLDHLHSH